MRQMQSWGPPMMAPQPRTGGLRRAAIVAAAGLVVVWLIGSNLGPRGLAVVGLGWVLWSLLRARRADGQTGRALVEYGVVAALLLLTVVPLPTVRKPAFLEDPPSVETSTQTIKERVGDFWQQTLSGPDRPKGGGR